MKLTQRGEHTLTALLAVSAAGLAHMWWTVLFDNALDFPVIITSCVTTCVAFAVMMLPNREA